jgi:3-phenylpropionate/cinnamic acid dioxygenase small subunit
VIDGGDVAVVKNERTGPALVGPELQHEIEQFLYYEAELLDERRYREWYDLMADDIHYWAPTRYNRTSRELDQENSSPHMVANFDDDKQSLGWRVTQYESGMHWAEDPPSRTRHIVSNVRIRPRERADEYTVRSNFLCYRNRLETEVDIWVGQREDTLRRAGPAAFQVAERTILLDQSVILSKNMSVLF